MPLYPFKVRDHEVIDHFTGSGYSLESDSKKELRFINKSNGRLAAFNRVNKSHCLNLAFGTASDFSAIIGVTKTSDGSMSSNLLGFPASLNKNGDLQTQGVRVVVANLTSIPAVLGAV